MFKRCGPHCVGPKKPFSWKGFLIEVIVMLSLTLVAYAVFGPVALVPGGFALLVAIGGETEEHFFCRDTY